MASSPPADSTGPLDSNPGTPFNVRMPAGFEIERKFLLTGVPALPDGAERWRIEQGYLAPWSVPAAEPPRLDDLQFGYGRLRRTTMRDGAVICTHTIKSGSGVKRMEQEREVTAEEFERHWPRTLGRRLNKIRWRVPHGALIWEIDDIESGWLALAEVELEEADQHVAPPQWLAAHIVREVTEDPTFTNSAIAERIGGARIERGDGEQ